MTDFRTSRTTLEIDDSPLGVDQLIARPGTLPAITVPMNPRVLPDAGAIWAYLAEPAEFFDVEMPPLDDLSAALSDVAVTFSEEPGGLVAANVTISGSEHGPRILVTGSAVPPLRREPVRIDGSTASLPALHGATDPWWRRMAARTTSRGEADQCERWLNGRGYADGLCDGGEPLLGALVFEFDGHVVGVENGEPTSVLDQLAQCGVIAAVDRIGECRTGAERVWWVSPRYQTHPVTELGGTPYPVEPDAVPLFARWS